MLTGIPAHIELLRESELMATLEEIFYRADVLEVVAKFPLWLRFLE